MLISRNYIIISYVILYHLFFKTVIFPRLNNVSAYGYLIPHTRLCIFYFESPRFLNFNSCWTYYRAACCRRYPDSYHRRVTYCETMIITQSVKLKAWTVRYFALDALNVLHARAVDAISKKFRLIFHGEVFTLLIHHSIFALSIIEGKHNLFRGMFLLY